MHIGGTAKLLLGMGVSFSAAWCGPGATPTPRLTASISIAAGYGNTKGAGCSPGTSGVVTVTVAPQNLTGTKGLDTRQSDQVSLPQFATEVDHDIESGAPIYGCQVNKSFFNLKPGTWLVSVTGALRAGTCTRSISAGQDLSVKIWEGVCL